jgi:hypothetical protein
MSEDRVMRDDQDERIADLLNADAPPVRDPVFRIRVLERREHRRFQRRSLTMAAGALVIIVVSAFAIGIGGGAMQRTGALVVGTALAIAWPAFRRSLPRFLRRFSI